MIQFTLLEHASIGLNITNLLHTPKSLIKHVHDNEDKEKEGVGGYIYDSNIPEPSDASNPVKLTSGKDSKDIESYRLLIVYRGSIFLNQIESGVKTCQLCGYKVDAYWFKHHQCESR